MEVIIGGALSMIASYSCGVDFCTSYTFITMGIRLYDFWINHTNDKTASQ